jgi:dolichyl-phosphate-mannose--protein O-mannosyl transferase
MMALRSKCETSNFFFSLSLSRCRLWSADMLLPLWNSDNRCMYCIVVYMDGLKEFVGREHVCDFLVRPCRSADDVNSNAQKDARPEPV